MRLKVRCVCLGVSSQGQLGAYFVGFSWCPEGDLNPHSPLGPADFKSAASADFAIRARIARHYAYPPRLNQLEGAIFFEITNGLVELGGIEPPTSSLRTRRSPS